LKESSEITGFLRSIKKLDYQSAEMTRYLFLQLFCMDTLFFPLSFLRYGLYNNSFPISSLF